MAFSASGTRRLEDKAEAVGVDHLDALHLFMQGLGRRATVPLERELRVFCRTRVPIVESQART